MNISNITYHITDKGMIAIDTCRQWCENQHYTYAYRHVILLKIALFCIGTIIALLPLAQRSEEFKERFSEEFVEYFKHWAMQLAFILIAAFLILNFET